MMKPSILLSATLLLSTGHFVQADESSTLHCRVVDSVTGNPLAARVYVQTGDGKWLFARSQTSDGSAVIYNKQRFERSVERHTTVSAHPFVVQTPRGQVTVRVERGKEYLPYEASLEIPAGVTNLEITLQRWINMADRGWYSGDTHVHRTLEELPNVMLAEDLNVGLPLSYWVTKAYAAPDRGETSQAALALSGQPSDELLKPELIEVDPTHVIYPVNTEYEIFSVGDHRHTLGAVFALGHTEPFDFGVPPVRHFADQARRQGAILDLDKHSWPWSLMLVPVARVQLFELANNHCWQTEFGFRSWTADVVPDYMQIERDAGGLTEWGWINFGFKTYYALLNCGFPMYPSAGTASGVHPVPLGFGRVYVRLPGGFSYQAWMQGLAAGRSFVTTGPMLMVQVDGQAPGSTLSRDDSLPEKCRVQGMAVSSTPLKPIEIVVNGEVVRHVSPANRTTDQGAYESPIDIEVPIHQTSWVAVRAFEDHADNRVRFAHSSPVHIKVSGKPLRPSREQVEYLVSRMEQELDRNRGVLKEADLQEYEEALNTYRQLKSRSHQ